MIFEMFAKCLFFVPYLFPVRSLFVKYTHIDRFESLVFEFESLVFEMLVKYLHVCVYLNYK